MFAGHGSHQRFTSTAITWIVLRHIRDSHYYRYSQPQCMKRLPKLKLTVDDREDKLQSTVSPLPFPESGFSLVPIVWMHDSFLLSVLSLVLLFLLLPIRPVLSLYVTYHDLLTYLVTLGKLFLSFYSDQVKYVFMGYFSFVLIMSDRKMDSPPHLENVQLF